MKLAYRKLNKYFIKTPTYRNRCRVMITRIFFLRQWIKIRNLSFEPLICFIAFQESEQSFNKKHYKLWSQPKTLSPPISRLELFQVLTWAVLSRLDQLLRKTDATILSSIGDELCLIEYYFSHFDYLKCWNLVRRYVYPPNERF